MDQTSVRYIVDDLNEAIDFYSANLDFEEVMRAGSGFAMLRRLATTAVERPRRRRGCR